MTDTVLRQATLVDLDIPMPNGMTISGARMQKAIDR
jgi:hypothetical protein